MVGAQLIELGEEVVRAPRRVVQPLDVAMGTIPGDFLQTQAQRPMSLTPLIEQCALG